MYYIGVDIGGMSVKVGIVDDDGKVVAKTAVKTASTPKTVIKNLVKQINDVLSANGLFLKDIKGIGIGCPGTVSSEEGLVDYANNLNWRRVKLVGELKKSFNTDIRISNDANVAALGEAVFGCGKFYKNSIMFTLGTGVGGGIVIDGKLYAGNESKGAELGHSVIVIDGEPCTCGRRGCIESYVSATALIRQTKCAMERDKNSEMWKYAEYSLDNVNGKTAFECAKLGDATAIEVRDEYIKYLGESILNMFNIFRPDAFILGGGVSSQGKYLTDLLDKYCEDRLYGYEGTPKVDILTATLGNDAGIIGAAALLK